MPLTDADLSRYWNIAVRDDACDMLVPSDIRQLVATCQRQRKAIADAVEAIERGSTSAPVLEALKVAATS